MGPERGAISHQATPLSLRRAHPGGANNINGTPVYPTAKCTITGMVGDYCAMGQVKTTKNAAGAEIAFTNPAVSVPFPPGSGDKGATAQNALTPISAITDGTSNTTLWSEKAGGMFVYTTGNVQTPHAAGDTGMAWADSDTRITVTGTSLNGLTTYGLCVMNCNNTSGDVFSFHVGGANIAFADGHVTFVSDLININLLVSMVTRGGGESVETP